MKIGILGGTFNPIHKGHMNMANYIKKSLNFDKVILMPTNIPPHKAAENLVDGVDRFNMCKLAAYNHDGIEVCDMELRRNGQSFTVDTLDKLKKTNPDDQFYLIMGSDMFLSFDMWYRFEDIIKMAYLCVFSRTDEDVAGLKNQKKSLENLGAKVLIQDAPILEMSSTEIREKIFRKQDISVYLDENVSKYIDVLQLYSGQIDPKIALYERVIKENLSKSRYIHSKNVAKESVRLGIIYGANLNNAYISGLLHDVCKEKSDAYALQIFADSDIIFSGNTKHQKALWHSILGAAFVQNNLLIDDKDIINAIRYHTTARKGMSVLEETVYIADLTSFERDYDDLEDVRKLADISRSKCILKVLSFSLQKLIKKQTPICDDSWQAYNYYSDLQLTSACDNKTDEEIN